MVVFSDLKYVQLMPAFGFLKSNPESNANVGTLEQFLSNFFFLILQWLLRDRSDGKVLIVKNCYWYVWPAWNVDYLSKVLKFTHVAILHSQILIIDFLF